MSCKMKSTLQNPDLPPRLRISGFKIRRTLLSFLGDKGNQPHNVVHMRHKNCSPSREKKKGAFLFVPREQSQTL